MRPLYDERNRQLRFVTENHVARVNEPPGNGQQQTTSRKAAKRIRRQNRQQFKNDKMKDQQPFGRKRGNIVIAMRRPYVMVNLYINY